MAVRSPTGSSEIDTPAPVASLGPDLQQNIGRQLRLMFDEVLSEPVPERLHELLAQLDRKSSDRS